jgi:hypothetical protein
MASIGLTVAGQIEPAIGNHFATKPKTTFLEFLRYVPFRQFDGPFDLDQRLGSRANCDDALIRASHDAGRR